MTEFSLFGLKQNVIVDLYLLEEVITHTVAQVFRVENVAWPACVRRDRDHVSGPFYVFVLFFFYPSQL